MRPADSCNPHFKDEHPYSLGIPTRLRSKLRAADELYASTTLGPLRPACPAEPRGHCRPTRSDQGLTSGVASPPGHCSRGFKALELRPSDRDRFHRCPLKVDGFPDPRRLPSAGSSFEPFSDLAATRAAIQVSAPFRPLRVHRFGLGPFPRSQPRPRAASGARHRLPTSATNPQSKGTPGKRRFHARSSPFRRSPFASSP